MRADPILKMIVTTYVIVTITLTVTISEALDMSTGGVHGENSIAADGEDYIMEDELDRLDPRLRSSSRSTSGHAAGGDLSAEAKNLQKQFDTKHANKPHDVTQFANSVVADLFRKWRGTMPTMEVMQILDDLRGVHKLQALQIIEKMDLDNDGVIDEEEFMTLYGTVAADPSNFFSAMYSILDFNGDSVISIWELLRQEASKLGYDYDLVELHRLAQQKFIEMDADNNDKISLEEYITYLVYLITKSVGKIKKDTQELAQT